MKTYRSHLGTRTAVLRPQNVELAIRRLAEWNVIMDKALDANSLDKRAADAAWLAMKKEQPWSFLGWLGVDTASVLDSEGEVVGAAQPGDMHEDEKALERWRRS